METWEKQRDWRDFAFLIDHSPFSINEQNIHQISSNYVITGFCSINHEETLFIMDSVKKNSEMVTHQMNVHNIKLVSIQWENGIIISANILVAGNNFRIGWSQEKRTNFLQPSMINQIDSNSSTNSSIDKMNKYRDFYLKNRKN